MARDLRRTLAACRAKTGATVERAVLVGGGARVNGMAEYLSEQLGVPITRLTPADHEAILGQKLASSGVVADTACLAAGVAFEGATGRPQFDMRQGSLAYKADLSFLRAKAGQLVAAALVLIAFAAGSAYASLYKLRSAEAVLDERLAIESTEAFGESLEADEVLDRIGPAEDGKRKTPIPEMTAYDILLAINTKLPARDVVHIEIHEVDIKAEKISLRGTATPTEKEDALAGIDKLEEELKKSKCFKDYTMGETQPGANDSREFSLSIKSSCN
jgi:general secretion pathway protein L